MDSDLLEQARQNCVSRAEALMEAEMSQIRAKHQARLNPSETLIKLEAFRLLLQKSKAAFTDFRDEEGLELFSTVQSQLDRLAYELATGR